MGRQKGKGKYGLIAPRKKLRVRLLDPRNVAGWKDKTTGDQAQELNARKDERKKKKSNQINQHPCTIHNSTAACLESVKPRIGLDKRSQYILDKLRGG